MVRPAPGPLAVLAALAVFVTAGPAPAADYTWTNTAGGNWNVGGNWSGGVVPGAADNATIGTAGTYTVGLTDVRGINNLTLDNATATLSHSDGALTVGGTFALNAGTLDLSFGGNVFPAIRVNGAMTTAAGTTFNWSSGLLQGAGPITLGGSTVIGGGPSDFRYFDATITNTGTMTWANGARVTNDGTLNNAAGGLIDFQNALNTTVIDRGRLLNAGTLRHSGTGTSRVAHTGSFRWENSGLIEVLTGSLTIDTSGNNTGVVTVSDGATFGGTIITKDGGAIRGSAGGTGRYEGPLLFEAGGTLSPGGAQAGGLTTGDLLLQSGSTFEVGLIGTAPVTGYDRVSVTGNVTLLNNPTLAVTADGLTPGAGDKFFILVNDGADAVTGRFAGLPDGGIGGIPGYSFQISYFGDFGSLSTTGGNDVVLYDFVPVTEPKPVLAAAAVGVGLLARSRRRRTGRFV